MDSELTHTEKILGAAHKQLPHYIKLANQLIILCDIEERKKQATERYPKESASILPSVIC
jgi:hypothetical protein